MIEDELLKLRFKHGSRDALRRIYEKYRDYLLTLAIALLNDVNVAEDVLHDVFVTFVSSSENFKLHGSLKGYLATCVINRARDRVRLNRRQSVKLEDMAIPCLEPNGPDQLALCNEESKQLNHAIAQLPYEQRETVTLHLIGQMKFKEIAQLQGVSVNTIKGRYRYGLNKLRSILNGEMNK